MLTPETSGPLDNIGALMQRFIDGDLELEVVVQAFRALPSGISGDFAIALDESELSPTTQARLDALSAALSE